MTNKSTATSASTKGVNELFEQINDRLVMIHSEIYELRELVEAARRLREDAEDRTFAQQAQSNARRVHDNVRGNFDEFHHLPRDRYGRRIRPLSQD